MGESTSCAAKAAVEGLVLLMRRLVCREEMGLRRGRVGTALAEGGGRL